MPSKSTFYRKKDLAPATLRRVAKSLQKFVIDHPQPFIVPIANWSGESVQSAHVRFERLQNITPDQAIAEGVGGDWDANPWG